MSLVSVLYYRVDISATGRSLLQRSPTGCLVTICVCVGHCMWSRNVKDQTAVARFRLLLLREKILTMSLEGVLEYSAHREHSRHYLLCFYNIWTLYIIIIIIIVTLPIIVINSFSPWLAQQPKSGLEPPIVEVSRSHTFRQTYLVGFLWTSDQPVAVVATNKIHNKHKTWRSVISAGLEPAISPIEGLQTYALDRRMCYR
jgi:hypothetical protein